jgi:serine/threonine protein kinase
LALPSWLFCACSTPQLADSPHPPPSPTPPSHAQTFIILDLVDVPNNLFGVVRGDAGHRHQLALVRREAHMFASLDHANVLKLIGVLVDAHGDITGLVMELASDTLEGLCRKRGVGTVEEPGTGEGLTLHALWVTMLGAARGLAYLHAQAPPVYHRDLKGDNLFVVLGEHGAIVDVKLGDFGDAKVRRRLACAGFRMSHCCVLSSPHVPRAFGGCAGCGVRGRLHSLAIPTTRGTP